MIVFQIRQWGNIAIDVLSRNMNDAIFMLRDNASICYDVVTL